MARATKRGRTIIDVDADEAAVAVAIAAANEDDVHAEKKQPGRSRTLAAATLPGCAPDAAALVFEWLELRDWVCAARAVGRAGVELLTVWVREAPALHLRARERASVTLMGEAARLRWRARLTGLARLRRLVTNLASRSLALVVLADPAARAGLREFRVEANRRRDNLLVPYDDAAKWAVLSTCPALSTLDAGLLLLHVVADGAARDVLPACPSQLTELLLGQSHSNDPTLVARLPQHLPGLAVLELGCFASCTAHAWAALAAAEGAWVGALRELRLDLTPTESAALLLILPRFAALRVARLELQLSSEHSIAHPTLEKLDLGNVNAWPAVAALPLLRELRLRAPLKGAAAIGYAVGGGGPDVPGGRACALAPFLKHGLPAGCPRLERLAMNLAWRGGAGEAKEEEEDASLATPMLETLTELELTGPPAAHVRDAGTLRAMQRAWPRLETLRCAICAPALRWTQLVAGWPALRRLAVDVGGDGASASSAASPTSAPRVAPAPARPSGLLPSTGRPSGLLPSTALRELALRCTTVEPRRLEPLRCALPALRQLHITWPFVVSSYTNAALLAEAEALLPRVAVRQLDLFAAQLDKLHTYVLVNASRGPTDAVRLQLPPPRPRAQASSQRGRHDRGGTRRRQLR